MLLQRGLTFELRRDRRQTTRPGPVKMYGVGVGAVLVDVIEDASNEFTTLVRLTVQQAYEHWRGLDGRMRWNSRTAKTNSTLVI